MYFVSYLVSEHEIHKRAVEYLKYDLVTYVEELLIWEDLEI